MRPCMPESIAEMLSKSMTHTGMQINIYGCVCKKVFSSALNCPRAASTSHLLSSSAYGWHLQHSQKQYSGRLCQKQHAVASCSSSAAGTYKLTARQVPSSQQDRYKAHLGIMRCHQIWSSCGRRLPHCQAWTCASLCVRLIRPCGPVHISDHGQTASVCKTHMCARSRNALHNFKSRHASLLAGNSQWE